MTQKMSKRERQKAKKKERQKINAAERNARLRKEKIKSGFKWLAIIIVVFLIGFWAYGQLSKDKGMPFMFGSVHWHAKIDITTCGESRGFEHLGSRSQHFGGGILHTHGDNTYHLEGDPRYMSQASLGAFFKSINIPFSNEGIWEYTNGDACLNGSDGELRVVVNGQEIQNATGYSPKDGDAIKIAFE